MLLHGDKMMFVPLTMGHKDRCISRFEITMDKAANYHYRPGEEISGNVELEISFPLEICFLEFTVCGYAAVCAIHAQQGLSLSKKERYLKKRILVLGSGDLHKTTVIIPGKYKSQFSFRLPKELPSTNTYEDKKGSLAFNVRYFVQSRLCDLIWKGGSHHGSSKRRPLVRVLMAQHKDFIVERPFDIASVSMATWPVSQSEEASLGCGPFDNEQLLLTATLDRSAYSAGDEIIIKFETDVGDIKHYKSVRCDLRQRVVIRRTVEVLYFVTTTTTVKEPSWRIERVETERPIAVFKARLQTTRSFLPSILEGCDLIGVSYVVKISVRIANQAARMAFEVPLAVAPSNNTFPGALQDVTVPVFNRPIRFPRFSNSHNAILSGSTGDSGDSQNLSNQSSESQTSDDARPLRKQVRISVQV